MNNGLPLISSLLCCLFAISLGAQTKVQLSVGNVSAPSGQTPICVPVVADSFPNIASVGFSLRWDSTVVLLDNLDYGTNPLNITEGSVSRPDAASLVVSFLTDGLRGITLDPGTTIFQLCFSPQRAEGSSTITWEGINPAEFTQENQITAFPAELIPGSVAYGGALVTTTVYPGDTNDDGQVDHRDVLNIGLLNGTSGPARSDASSNFSAQTATVWGQQLSGGADVAIVDADGNGTVGSADVGIVETNYGSARSGFTDATDVSAQFAPELAVVFSDTELDAGQTTTATVRLNTNGSAVTGYGLAFALEFTAGLVDPASVTVSLDGSALGNDLFTVVNTDRAATGRIELALVKTDGNDASITDGTLVTLNFTPVNSAGTTQDELSIRAAPNAFVGANRAVLPIRAANATTINVSGSTATREPAWGAAVSLYPNPVTDGPVTLSGAFPRLTAIRLIDAAGRLVSSFPATQRRFDLHDLANGTYTLQLARNGQIVSRKLVKR